MCSQSHTDAPGAGPPSSFPSCLVKSRCRFSHTLAGSKRGSLGTWWVVSKNYSNLKILQPWQRLSVRWTPPFPLSCPYYDCNFSYPGSNMTYLKPARTLVSPCTYWLPVNHRHAYWPLAIHPIFAQGQSKKKKKKWKIHAPPNWPRQKVHISYLRMLGCAGKVHISARL